MKKNRTIEIQEMFKYYLSYEDWDFGPDESTGEPTAWPVEAYNEISRDEALRMIKAGRKAELVIRPAKGQTDRHRFPALWCWDAARGCLVEDLPF